jgi:ribosomal-protein-alanine N-acetyltransferase
LTSSDLKSPLDRLIGSERKCLPVPILTPRLELRPFCEYDIPSISRILCDPLITQFIGGPVSGSDAAKAVLKMRDAFQSRGWGTLAVVPLGQAECAGYCGVRPLTQTSDVEIAFALDSKCWNRGYATEAARACIDASFRALDIDSIVATVYPENEASCKVLKKLGLTIFSRVFGNWPRESALLFRIERDTWRLTNADTVNPPETTPTASDV